MSSPGRESSAAQSSARGRCAGAGFGIGLWAGLAAFDDAVNSDRKVTTSAIVGAGVGGVADYLIGRARSNRSHPSTTASATQRGRQEAVDPRLLEQLAKSIRFDRGRVRSTPPLSAEIPDAAGWDDDHGPVFDSCS